MRGILTAIPQLIRWQWNRLVCAWRRFTGEDALFQVLYHVQEANSAVGMLEADASLVQDWEPQEYKRHVTEHLVEAEAELHKMGVYY